MSKPQKSLRPYIPLHTHTHYSLLEGLTKIKPLVERAKKNKFSAIAITDNGNMYGAIEFYKTCEANDIKPIIGIDAFITPGKHTDKVAGVDNVRYRLTLLAETTEGYKNLMRLSSIAYTEGFYYKPRIDKDLLRKYHEGIICLSGGFGSEITRNYREGDSKRAEETAKEYREIFGKDNYFLEVQHMPNLEYAAQTRAFLIELGKKLDISIVATKDSFYLDPDDAAAQDVHLAIGQGVDIHHDNRFTMNDEDFSFINQKQANEYFKDIPEALDNTEVIANRCTLKLDLGNWTFPDLKIEGVTSFDDELRRVAYEGIERRGLKRTDKLIKRLDYELDVIKDKGFSVYFLIVGDLIRHARKHNIYSTIRGSVAGSMTTYLLGITNVDPFEYKLPFERFLNPERPSAPDIDMDFADSTTYPDTWEEIRDLLRNQDFRIGLSVALDRQRLIDVAWDGIGYPTNATISPQAWHFASPEGQAVYEAWRDAYVEYDPESAMAHFDAAGFVDADGDGYRDLPSGAAFTLVLDQGDWGGQVIPVISNETYAGNLEAVGIKVLINDLMGQPDWTLRQEQGLYMLRNMHASELDIWTYPDWMFPLRNNRAWPLEGRYRETGGAEGWEPQPGTTYAYELQALYDKGLAEPDIQKRHEIVWEAIQIHIDHGPFMIGGSGDQAMPVVVRNGFMGIPDLVILGPWAPGSPGNLNPEQFWMQEDLRNESLGQ